MTTHTLPPTAFQLGAHVRYVGWERRALPIGPARREVVLIPGMVGVVILSSGPSRPGHCRVQFRNGYQLDITPDNRGQFEETLEGACAVN